MDQERPNAGCGGMKMFRVLNILQTKGNSVDYPSGKGVRCVILADNTTGALPTTGENVDGLKKEQNILPGSVAITTGFNVAIMGNDGEWGEWK